MFQISYETNLGKNRTLKIVDENLAYDFFSKLIQCIDIKECTVIDGLTGEVLTQWIQGHMTVVNGFCVK